MSERPPNLPDDKITIELTWKEAAEIAFVLKAAAGARRLIGEDPRDVARYWLGLSDKIRVTLLEHEKNLPNALR